MRRTGIDGTQRTALVSVAAAAFLVAVKVVTGLVTGSLAFLAEAAHSATDLIAAALTFFAVRVAGRPADDEHQYGHGKAQHLAALAESAFLVAVSVAIAVQAVRRLDGGGHVIDVTWWAIAVLVLVIAVDLSRMVISRRGARIHRSAALQANALHFGADMLGSAAVLIGLAFVSAGYHAADAIAALIVAVLVVAAAARLARQSIDVLMDRTSAESDAAIRAALDEFCDELVVHRVRTRYAGGAHFVDLVVGVAADAGLTHAHATADEVEAAVRRRLPATDVVVHVEPHEHEGSLRERATAAALAVPEVREVHNVRAMRIDGTYELSLHAKVPGARTLTEAHDASDRVEQSIQQAVPELGRIYTHIEPLAETAEATRAEGDAVTGDREAIEAVAVRHTGQAPIEVAFRDSDRGRIALVTVAVDGDATVREAHRIAGRIEADLRRQRPALADAIVHTEPA